MPEPSTIPSVDPLSRGQVRDYELLIVAYRSRPLVERLLNTFPPDLPVIVVDNGENVDGLAEVVAGRPAIRYFTGPGRGFAVAANLGARQSTAEYLVLVNPDSAPTVEQFDTLVADLRADPSLGAVSAITTLPDGRVELGVGGWEPTVARAIVHAVGAHTLFPTAGLWARPRPHRPIELDWLSGACMAVPRRVLEQVGGLDESFFVYNEDVVFGRQLREAGLHLRVRTDVLVPHIGGGSGSARTWMAQYRGASMVQYFARYHRRAAVLALRLVLTLGLGIRALVRLVQGRRALTLEHVAYVKGLWAGAPEPE